MTFNISIDNKTVVRVVLLVLALTIGLAAVTRMQSALTMVGSAVFAALALNPAVSWLANHLPSRGKHRALATGIAFIFVLSFLGAILYATVPPIVKEGRKFAQTFPRSVQDVRNRNQKVGELIDKYDLQPRIDTAVNDAKKRFSTFDSNIVGSVSRVTNSVLNTLSIVVMTFLFLVEGPALIKSSKLLFKDEKKKKRFYGILGKFNKVITGYVNGQLSVAFVAAVLAAVFMLIVKVPYPLPLALVVFFFGLIPMVGNIIGALVVALAALVLKGVPSAVIMLAYFIIYQQIENLTLQPLIQSKATKLSPLIVFVSVILGVGLMGPIGGLIAIPIAGCVKELLLDYLEHREDENNTPKGLVKRLKDRAAVKKLVEADAKK